LFVCLLFAPAANAATYTWVGTGGNNNWSNANNWDPVRTPATDDVLVFDGSRTASASVYVDFVSPQAIGQMRFVNSVSVVFTVQPDANVTPARQLNIGAVLEGSDFAISVGSALHVKSPEGMKATAGLTMQLALGETADIDGTLIFGNSSTASLTNDPHRLTVVSGKDSNAIHFNSGSVFKAERLFSGEAFGSGTALNNTVVFKSGSVYEQRGGGAPFANNQPNSVVTLGEGSRYIYATNTAAGPQLPGRTYGFLEYDGTNSSTIGAASTAIISPTKLTVTNSLIIRQGNIRLNVVDVIVKGDLVMNGGTFLNPTGSSTITLNGNTTQHITSTAATAVSLGNNVTLAVDNAGGIIVQTPLQIAKSLMLANGVVNTATGALTLLAGANFVANEKSFVNGPLTRVVAASGNTSLTFPIGFGAAYRPLTLTVDHTDGAEVRYTAEHIKGKPQARVVTGDIKKVSAVRHFSVTRTSTASNLVSVSIKLSYGTDDQVDSIEKLRVAKSSADNLTWDDLGGTGGGVPTGTITSSMPFTSFGTFVLASTDAGAITGAGVNPLPVELISFSAERRAPGVLLRWATAIEKNNAGFEVERSTDGRLFETVGNVKGQGQSTQKQMYSILDTAPFSISTVYYRLRQLDFDGTATYSNVVGVKGESKEALFPNPARNQLTFRLPYDGAAYYRILSSTGQVVQKGQSSSNLTTLDISGLPTGFYYLEIEAAERRLVRKFIKQAD
jgi:hypothetical protein